jgi:DNA polymerase-3 subunit chi
MTEILFHTHVADPAAYACRLVRKASRQGARVAVTGPEATLERLDRELWAFDPVEFIPHLRLARGASVAPRLRATPVWLVVDPGAVDVHEILVNLGADSVPGFESYLRLFEVVSNDDADKAAARRRWKHYGDRGYRIAHHEIRA